MSETNAPVNEAVAALLDLQEIDRTRDRLHERREHLPQRAELADVEARIAEVTGVIARVQRDADDLMREEKKVEEEVRLIEEKIKTEEDKMYSGKVINPKEVSAIQAEVEMLRNRKAPLEERGLEELEARDSLMEERTKLEEELRSLEEEANGVRAKIGEAEGEIDRELEAEDARRAEVRPKVPDDTLELYEEIRASKRGVGVGALSNGMCTACREALSAVELDRIKRRAREGEWLFRCEHCRRLLVVR
jgi:predicted  nucleic acid-binding Zn-ribbon protein